MPSLPLSRALERLHRGRAVELVGLHPYIPYTPPTFTAPSRQRAEGAARLSNGADVTVTESPGTVVGPRAAADLARIPGVAAVEPVQHRFAYVGADLQDLYGVRPATIVDATSLQNAYFAGGTAPAPIARL